MTEENKNINNGKDNPKGKKMRQLIVETDGGNIFVRKMEMTPLEAYSIASTLKDRFAIKS